MEDCRRPHVHRLLLALVILGLGLRAYHYLADPPMWHDEAAQVVNILDKSFADFQGPLYYAEASPPAFMWILKAWTLVWGDGTLALRFIPWLASCLALMGMAWLSQRWLPGPQALVLTLFMACSDRLLWHACEAKAYAVDVFVTVFVLILLTLGPTFNPLVENRRLLGRQMLLMAALSPLLIFLSFPACFVLGGVALCWLPDAWRDRGLRWRYALFGFSLFASFLLLLLGPIRAQHVHTLQDDWAWNNPRTEVPWTIPLDLVRHVTEVFRYAAEPIGNLLSILGLVGGSVLWRQGHRRLLTLLLVPIGLNGLAWVLGRYPLGPSRVNAYLIPLVLLLVAAGFNSTWNWLRVRSGQLGPALLSILLLIPAGVAGYRLIKPWARLDSREPALFILNQRQADEPVVGTMWEHQYYLRGLGSDFRLLPTSPQDPPTLPPTQAIGQAEGLARRVWLVANSRDYDPRDFFTRLEPRDAWKIREEHRFRSMTVFRLERAEDERSGLAVGSE